MLHFVQKKTKHLQCTTHACTQALKHSYRKLLMSLGKAFVLSEVVRNLTCWQRKLFPSGLNVQEKHFGWYEGLAAILDDHNIHNIIKIIYCSAPAESTA